ncbi:hypothetical protein [Nostoc sp. 'Peltigera membranacea cyanobiont' 232]|uniref:hypothetical protein n=1 Tax=Nostoc sp. 'Peltigera membranacea cyanobiont' 232 TaxID=2014531 RepID=UPI000B95307E|nr:hypothetical protein [Nostoc sp. 'Peltigera membranacea cyanobiont' 232]OYE05792.1 hypothetical protein CDG79_05850 [Nostoc sp. 'Peltigera membranacea cyanobiont' 232]
MIKPRVEFIAPFRVYVSEEFFEVKLESKIFIVQSVPVPPAILSEGIQVHGKNIEISHDIFGYAGRTKFSVVIDEDIDISCTNWKNAFCDNEALYIQMSLSCVNRFLEVYRDQDKNRLGDKSFHVIPLVKSDLYNFRLVAIDEQFNEVGDFAIIRPAFHRTGFGTAVEREAEIINNIQVMLRNETSIPIYRDLINSARNYIWRGQYRLAPVEANTAFESFLPEIISHLDQNFNRSERLDLYNKLKRLQGILSSQLINSGYSSVVWFNNPPNGWQTLHQQELKTWYDDCYLLRNKVIHEGYNRVTREEAFKAYQGAVTAIDYIEAEIKKLI